MAFAISIANIQNLFGKEFFALTLLFILITLLFFGGSMPFMQKKYELYKK